MYFVAIVGTNNEHSTNRRLLQYMQQRYSDKATIEVLEISDFPAFNEPEERTFSKTITSHQSFGRDDISRRCIGVSGRGIVSYNDARC